MALLLSPIAYAEKNKLASDGVWAVMLEIYIPQLNDYLRVCSNTEDMNWDGKNWQSFPFGMDEIGDYAKGEIPQFVVRVCNINGTVQSYVDDADGATGATVKMFIVNTKTIDSGSEIELEFRVKSTSIDEKWASFTLGVVNPYSILIGQRLIRTGCRFTGEPETRNGFKGSRCKYSGSATECNKTLTRCRELKNSANFGGAPGIGIGSTFYV